MRIRKNPTAAPCEADPWAASTYQTGSTTPPKSHSWLIALLLVVVILLCGVITVLGITNVRLFRMLSGQEESANVPISFSDRQKVSAFSTAPASVQTYEDALSVTLGIRGDSVPKAYQLYYRLPCGLYVQQVDPASSCARVGIRRGDIVIRLGGTDISCPQDFYDALAGLNAGDTVTMVVHRNSRVFSVSVTVEPLR